jgi:hypothetical protein
MAREKVVKIQCDRCKRVELVPEVADKVGADLDASFNGQRLVYQDLCIKCRETIAHIWVDLKEWDREVKYTVITNGPKIREDEAPPMAVPTNFSPPKPHSAAGGDR